MYILGISCFYHDSAVALLKDGELIAGAEEERFSRKKHDFGFPSHAIRFCLQQAGITGQELDYVVFYEKPLIKFERILMSTLSTYPRSWRVFREAMLNWFSEKLWIKSQIVRELDIPEAKVLFADHHMSHAASTLYCSPFKEAAILTIDGVGEWTTAAIGRGTASWDGQQRNDIVLSREIRFPNSLGLLYSAFTAFLGFRVNNGEYKVMGMAPYGQPRYVDRVRKVINVADDGSFRLNMDYFSFHHSTEHTYNAKFVELFGKKRDGKSEFFTRELDFQPGREAEADQNQYYADVAASIQAVTEDVLLKLANQVHKETGLDTLCMAGGVALNSVANGRILRETPFKNLFIQPAAGDSGCALGAALYAYHILLQQPRRLVLEHGFWGAEYSEAQVQAFLDANGIRYQYFENDDQLMDRVTDLLLQGKVVGWYQGRFEWGPRALGNRSILADPRGAEMKDIVNRKIKFREPFRPFAPAVLEERTQEFFELENPEQCYPARFMLLVTPVHEDKQAVIPAVTHVGGTSRLQTVRREWNPRYYEIIRRFGEATGVPVLLNTSYNLRGEPIVASPAEAFHTYSHSDMDAVAYGQYLVQKDKG
jgi:carbamoyltransferase